MCPVQAPCSAAGSGPEPGFPFQVTAFLTTIYCLELHFPRGGSGNNESFIVLPLMKSDRVYLSFPCRRSGWPPLVIVFLWDPGWGLPQPLFCSQCLWCQEGYGESGFRQVKVAQMFPVPRPVWLCLSEQAECHGQVCYGDLPSPWRW